MSNEIFIRRETLTDIANSIRLVTGKEEWVKIHALKMGSEIKKFSDDIYLKLEKQREIIEKLRDEVNRLDNYDDINLSPEISDQILLLDELSTIIDKLEEQFSPSEITTIHENGKYDVRDSASIVVDVETHHGEPLVANSEEEFRLLDSAENLGKVISYNGELYLVTEG